MNEVAGFSEFHNAEYVALRAEILQLANQVDRLVALSIAAAGGIAAWLTTNGKDVSPVFWLAPLVILGIAYGFYNGKYHSVWVIGRYLQQIEIRYRADEALGWEHFLDRHRPNKKVLWTERFTWGFLFFASSLFFLLKIYPSLTSRLFG